MNNLENQLRTMRSKFNLPRIEVEFQQIKARKDCVPLLVIPANYLPTKTLLNEIDLGKKGSDLTFDMNECYNLVKCPPYPYVIEHVNISAVEYGLLEPRESYKFKQPRPLTLHESATLLFLYPHMLGDKTKGAIYAGIVSHGSRVQQNETPSFNHDLVPEIHRFGNPGHAIAKVVCRTLNYHSLLLTPHTEREFEDAE